MARRSMREEIVGAGLRRFHELGYNAAGVKDITDEAGVPKGSFYNHFESKEALAVEALERYGAGLRLTDLADGSVAPLARIRGHFEFMRDRIVALEGRQGCLLGNLGAEVADHSEVIRSAVAGGWRSWVALLSAAIAQAQAAGEVGPTDPEATARFLINAWEGTLLEVRVTASVEAFEPFFALAFGRLLAP
ncbi:TetR/AcrR family transcriptional regulator [Dactylosporangium darangshiense]